MMTPSPTAPELARGQVRRFALVAIGVVVLDQLSKWWAVATLTGAFAGDAQPVTFAVRLQRFLWLRHPPRHQALAVIDSFWHFRYVENPGAAWGLLSGAASSFRTPFFLAVSVLAMVFILAYLRQTSPAQRSVRFGLALVFGGAVGNLFDRARLGYVIDFIDWHYFDRATWPTFNVADSAITAGVGLLLLDMFFDKER